ncbi:MAG: hypothetical protein IKZ26_05005 [Peptococcaceae bacterium]|nr:hypothetical protein [Peptococcaceae bacterium]
MNWFKRYGSTLLLFIAVFLMTLYGFQNTAESSAQEQLRLTEESLRRAVVSCYALEGRYPADIDYLKEHYGLQLNEEKYIVHYEIFAENIMPDITVIER